MIHYHGTPLTPTDAASRFFRARHAMVSFGVAQGRGQLPLLAEVCQSFALDNGAFTAWRAGSPVTDWSAYYAWVFQWTNHPACDWALIPDVIDGDEAANDALIEEWPLDVPSAGVPVWHLHESIERLKRLCNGFWPRVALGSSGEFAAIGTPRWWSRMGEAMDAICDDEGAPSVKLHGLRMLDPAVFSVIPLSSADSTNVARNIGIDSKWRGPYAAISPDVRAFVIADRVESVPAAGQWLGAGAIQHNFLDEGVPA